MLNPRGQVEHPCTETVVNVNPPAALLMVARGIPLHRIKSIRQRYNAPIGENSPDDFIGPARQPKPTLGTMQDPNFRRIITAQWAKDKDISRFLKSLVNRGAVEGGGEDTAVEVETRNTKVTNMLVQNLGSLDISTHKILRDVVALKELSIRSDVRTLVEHLVMILEREELQVNT